MVFTHQVVPPALLLVFEIITFIIFLGLLCYESVSPKSPYFEGFAPNPWHYWEMEKLLEDGVRWKEVGSVP